MSCGPRAGAAPRHGHAAGRGGPPPPAQCTALRPRRVAARDSGKAMLDAILGEVIVTCEKIHWLCGEGEKWLRPEKRSPGIMSFYKSARVEYHPVGVVGVVGWGGVGWGVVGGWGGVGCVGRVWAW